MDSSMFNRSFQGLWVFFALAGIGLIALAVGVLWLLWFLIQHVRWV